MAKVTSKLQIAPLPKASIEDRLRLFEQATARQKERERLRSLPPEPDRGWSREELYERHPPR